MSRTTLRTLLKQAGLSWKKSKKALGKANPQKRAEFVAELCVAVKLRLPRKQVRLIYIDEVHLHHI
ncbi:MAG: winged helix-turn-helix domain-containing protein [Anaerolineae bacterium]